MLSMRAVTCLNWLTPRACPPPLLCPEPARAWPLHLTSSPPALPFQFATHPSIRPQQMQCNGDLMNFTSELVGKPTNDLASLATTVREWSGA